MALLDKRKEFPYIILMILSKLTSKAQTTIPQAVRAALHVGAGDELAYQIEDGRVILTKASDQHGDDPFAVFHEWNSEADRKAFAGL
jgi:antitoxin PrlF